jgi:hypothetical protein
MDMVAATTRLAVKIAALIFVALTLAGCVTATPPVMAETTLGTRPVICYVYARRTRVLVPISCSMAQILY